MQIQDSNSHQNGNTNGHGKVFDLTARQDPLLAQVVPDARRRVCLNWRICEAARMFYCYLTDCSLLFGVNTRKGVVKFSDSDLALRFRVSAKTIRNWKRALEATGEIWLTEKFMKNSFPQTVYNITAIVGQATLPLNVDSNDGSLPEDEVFSSNRRRQQNLNREGSGKFACRLHGVSGCELCRHRTPPRLPVTAGCSPTLQISSENEPSGKILPSPTANGCRPPRQMVAAHRGNLLPSPTANGCRPARKTVAAVGGNGLPQGTENGFRGPRQTVADNRKTEIGEQSLSKVRGNPPPPEKQFLDWLKTLEGMFPSKLRRLEADLKARLESAQSDEARREWKRRLAAVRERLLGGPVQDDPAAKPKAKPARKIPIPEPTEAELLESARIAKEMGVKTFTNGQRAAMERAGELVK